MFLWIEEEEKEEEEGNIDVRHYLAFPSHHLILLRSTANSITYQVLHSIIKCLLVEEGHGTIEGIVSPHDEHTPIVNDGGDIRV